MNEEIIKKSRKSNFAFSSDRGGGKCTFTSFLKETEQRICRKPDKDRIHSIDNMYRKDLLH